MYRRGSLLYGVQTWTLLLGRQQSEGGALCEKARAGAVSKDVVMRRSRGRVPEGEGMGGGSVARLSLSLFVSLARLPLRNT